MTLWHGLGDNFFLNMTLKRTSIQLDEETIKKIDKIRGDISRSLFIRRAVETALK